MKVVQARVEDKLKKQAESIFDKLGLDMSTAIRMFLKKVSQVRGIPFDLNTEKGYYEFPPEVMAEIDRISKEAKEGKNLSPAFDNMDDAIKYLDEYKNEDDNKVS